MLTCKQITRLLSESQDRKLSVAEKLKLEMHLAMCRGCKTYKGQLTFLRAACQRYTQTHQDESGGQ